MQRVQKCPNHPVCLTSGAQRLFDLGRDGLCAACTSRFGRLFFIQPHNTASTTSNATIATPPAARGHECPICLEEGGEHVRMTCGGNHSVCTACFARPLRLTGYPTEFDFGCPKFRPGTQGQVDIISVWRRLFPAQFTAFRYALQDNARRSTERARAQRDSLARCPLCRGGSPWDGGNIILSRAGKT